MELETLVPIIANANGASGAVSVAAAKFGAGFSNIHMIYSPALLFWLFSFLNPPELSCTAKNRPRPHPHTNRQFSEEAENDIGMPYRRMPNG